MSDIATRAPKATVVAVGYPRMFAPQGAGQILPVPGRCEGVTKVDQRWINAKTNELNAAAGAAAQRHGYQFADPSGAFAGHELCGQQTSWFQSLIDDGRFHPNADGHKAMASSIMDSLNAQGQEAAQDQPAAAPAQLDNMRPTGAFTLTRDGDQLSLDASASTDADGAVANIDWYVQHANGTEEILTGAQATTTVPAGEQVSVTAVVTDNQGKEDFTTQVSAAG
jgi:putative secreted hydrolase